MAVTGVLAQTPGRGWRWRTEDTGVVIDQGAAYFSSSALAEADAVRALGSGWPGTPTEDFDTVSDAEEDGWHYVGSGGGEPAFTGDWTGDLAFRIREAGVVDLVGEVSYPGGVTALGSEVFVLPSDYRPSVSCTVYSVRVETSTDVVIGRIGITTDGSVVLKTAPLTDDMQSAEFAGQFFLAPPAF